MAQAYIVATARTAGGRRKGRLSGIHPVELAALALDAVVRRAGADPALVEDVVMGCVSQTAQQSSNIARNAVLASCLPVAVPAVTVDRQCGSSQQALHFAAQAVMAGVQDVVIAAGVESMSRVPMGLARTLPDEHGYGNYWSPVIATRYPGPMFSQFAGAELLAAKYDISRDEMDQLALESHRRAAEATRAGDFAQEIVAIDVPLPDGGTVRHEVDEGIRFDATIEALAGLKTVAPDGRVTAGNASQICDGSSAVMIVSERGLKAIGVEPLARIVDLTVLGSDPVIMLETPIAATRRALARAGLSIGGIDRYEVNEAFACVPIAWARETGADPARLNPSGGAIALGHPLGASGTKLMGTLVHGLRRTGGRYGLQAMCEAGGLANVTIIERL
ncbi:MAG: Acetyl-CoA C-acetyltransferase [Sphingomonas bacterium]|uniref:acetyl-CoA C-acetyltransferase n=1 Tax=Sphingomonas bacterium TaxID=1895847 RepID=UPI002627CEB4|nr:acetyl-CoA C-acetyltransferase [Sphingomonas bacterium]MDB5703866.1 Acetyl-CoA C-acetyltransferase [Sphingomonas bacterium]